MKKKIFHPKFTKLETRFLVNLVLEESNKIHGITKVTLLKDNAGLEVTLNVSPSKTNLNNVDGKLGEYKKIISSLKVKLEKSDASFYDY